MALHINKKRRNLLIINYLVDKKRIETGYHPLKKRVALILINN